MKQKTKALIEWIKAQIRIAAKLDNSYLITADATIIHKSFEREAEKFLDSLPEIESHLCRGGYIQDKNGTPCCEGDTIIFNEIYGKLIWDNRLCKFKIEYHETGTSFLFYSEIDRTKIEKVEK